jgi:hypothetical protein
MSNQEEKQFTIQELIDWCDKMSAEGKNPILKWEGGGDSGWVHMEDEDGHAIDCPEAEWLINEMYDTLDYGSWAGEFSANGEAAYNTKTKMFEGTDYYSEENRDTCNSDVVITIPANIPFNRLVIETSDYDSLNVGVSLEVDNLFTHPETHSIEEKIAEDIKNPIETTINDYVREEGLEFSSYYDNYSIDASEFKKVGNNLVYTMKELGFSCHLSNPKDVEIDLKQLLEDEN